MYVWVWLSADIASQRLQGPFTIPVKKGSNEQLNIEADTFSSGLSARKSWWVHRIVSTVISWAKSLVPTGKLQKNLDLIGKNITVSHSSWLPPALIFAAVPIKERQLHILWSEKLLKIFKCT